MKISIVMLVYNHERFIAQALDSILVQKTQYEYEIVLGEDCSTDHTREIVKSYEEKFQGRLKPMYREKNIGMTKNLIDCLMHCTGEYLAFLEGDDYWCDEKKLEKQVSFLEKHPEYVACTHNWNIVDLNGSFTKLGRKMELSHDYSLEQIGNFELPGQTATLVCRNIYRDAIRTYKKIVMKYLWIPMDRLVQLILLQYGKIRIFSEVGSCYRYYIEIGGSNWSSQHEVQAKKNRLYFYIMALGMEKISIKMETPINCMSTKARLFKENYRSFRSNDTKLVRSISCFFQGIIMFLMEPKRIKMFKQAKALKL